MNHRDLLLLKIKFLRLTVSSNCIVYIEYTTSVKEMIRRVFKVFKLRIQQ